MTKPLVLRSIEDETRTRCVDLFVRQDGSYGFEEFRRDPEDMGRWTPSGGYVDQRFDDEPAAEEAARRAVAWLESS